MGKLLMVQEFNFITVSPKIYIVIVLMLLLVPLPWLAGWVLAALIHELSHCIAVLLCGGKITAIKFSSAGIVLESGYLSTWRSVICSLAGPAGGLLLYVFSKRFPYLAICGFLQSVYNLLPIYPLDGGRAVRAICLLFFCDSTANKICAGLETVVLVVLLIISTILSVFLKYSIFPSLVVIIYLLRMKNIKIPCKSGLHAVQ